MKSLGESPRGVHEASDDEVLGQRDPVASRGPGGTRRDHRSSVRLGGGGEGVRVLGVRLRI